MLICGVDEAGRGPVIGPMVMAGVLVDEEGIESLRSLGVKDSKLLTPRKRASLYRRIISVVKKHKIIVIEPKDIDAALNSDSLNLNWLEAHTSARIINELKPEKVVVDSPSNNCEKYKRYLKKLLDSKEIEMIVEHKADVNYVECSAASILAKVTRDEEIEKIKKKVGTNFGSGYLTDPLTIKFLNENFSKHPGIFRKSWMTYKKLVSGKNQKKLGEF